MRMQRQSSPRMGKTAYPPRDRGPKSPRPGQRLTAMSYAMRVWEAIDTPTSLSCYLLAKSGEHEQLARKSVSASHYTRASTFFVDYQAVKLMSKFPNLDSGIDRQSVAMETFLASEKKCLETNARFRYHSETPYPGVVERVLSTARGRIATILGSVPNLEDLHFSFGPGAAYGVRGETSVYNKVAAPLECAYAFAEMLPGFLAEFPGWFFNPGIQDPDEIALVEVELVNGSQLHFVPKDAKTDRPICIEPLLNGLYQHGFGSYIRDRLKRHGVDLRDQGVNQGLAAVSHERKLATVDFSSASDTIAYGLVLDLLPIDWFEALDVARSPCYEWQGDWKTFQKFSSMGNAYTFELESLIFYAVAYGCLVEEDIRPMTGVNLSVYGDDVIIPQVCFDLFAEVSEFCGFSVNRSKSFHQGLFFESCGHDYFEGIFVRPVLITSDLDTLNRAFYSANSLVKMSCRLPSGETRFDVRQGLRSVHDWVVGCIPTPCRVWGPSDFGDGHLIAPFDKVCPPKPRGYRATWDGWEFSSYVERPIKISILDGPRGYSAYYTQKEGKGLPPFLFGSILESTDNGSSYTVRGKTRVARTRLISIGWNSPVEHDGWYHSVDDCGKHAGPWEGALRGLRTKILS